MCHWDNNSLRTDQWVGSRTHNSDSSEMYRLSNSDLYLLPFSPSPYTPIKLYEDTNIAPKPTHSIIFCVSTFLTVLENIIHMSSLELRLKSSLHHEYHFPLSMAVLWRPGHSEISVFLSGVSITYQILSHDILYHMKNMDLKTHEPTWWLHADDL